MSNCCSARVKYAKLVPKMTWFNIFLDLPPFSALLLSRVSHVFLFLYTLLLQIGFIPAFLTKVLEHALDWINNTNSRPYLLTATQQIPFYRFVFKSFVESRNHVDIHDSFFKISILYFPRGVEQRKQQWNTRKFTRILIILKPIAFAWSGR